MMAWQVLVTEVFTGFWHVSARHMSSGVVLDVEVLYKDKEKAKFIAEYFRGVLEDAEDDR